MPFKFKMTNKMVPATNSPVASTITLKGNNAATTLEIPSNYQSAGYADIVEYLRRSPISYSLTHTPSHTFPQTLIEFWYTCTMSRTKKGMTCIKATIGNGRSIVITVDDIRRYLQLPEGPYVEAPNSVDCRNAVLEFIRFPPPYTNSPTRTKMNAIWAYFFGIIVWCMGYKTGSMSQCNNYELQIGHALIFGQAVDFAALIFHELVEKIQKPLKDTTVPFPRFLSIIFEGILGEEYPGLEKFSVEDYIVGAKMFHRTIESPHQGLSTAMLRVLASDDEAPPLALQSGMTAKPETFFLPNF